MTEPESDPLVEKLNNLIVFETKISELINETIAASTRDALFPPALHAKFVDARDELAGMRSEIQGARGMAAMSVLVAGALRAFHEEIQAAINARVYDIYDPPVSRTHKETRLLKEVTEAAAYHDPDR